MEVYKIRTLEWWRNVLDFGGFFWDGFDVANVLLYHFEGRDTEAAITLLCLIPAMGNFLAIPVRLTLKLGGNAGEALIKLGKKYLPDFMEKGSRFLDWAGGKVDDVWRWIQKKLGKAGAKDSVGSKGVNKLPQGISEETFSQGSQLIKDRVGDISDDIVVQGSRASGTAKPTSDIDIAIRVTPEKFEELIKECFNFPNSGSAKERTMLHAIETGKIQAGEAGLRGLRRELEQIFGMEVDISIIKKVVHLIIPRLFLSIIRLHCFSLAQLSRV